MSQGRGDRDAALSPSDGPTYRRQPLADTAASAICAACHIMRPVTAPVNRDDSNRQQHRTKLARYFYTAADQQNEQICSFLPRNAL